MGRSRSFKYSSTFYRRKQKFLETINKDTLVSFIEEKQSGSKLIATVQIPVETGSENADFDNHNSKYFCNGVNTTLDSEIADSLFDKLEETANDNLTSFSYKLKRSLRQWAIRNKISHCALNDLLRELTLCGIRDMPSDCRTLLKTPRNVSSVEIMGKGHYWHNGLEKCLREMLTEVTEPGLVVRLNFHVDGLPINKSSKHQFWPILNNIANMPNIKPHIIAIFYGQTKPPSADIFLKKFTNELLTLLRTGITINDCFVQLKINAYICDTPARSFITCAVSFNAYHGCIKCTVQGEFFKSGRHMSFPQLDCPIRTDSGFRSKSDPNHHIKDMEGEFIISPLEELPIDMIKDIVVAHSLHLLDLGVMKKCLTLWVHGSKSFKTKFFANQITIISNWLLNCNKFLPYEFHRSVRQLDCLSFWKATEYRTFLLYLGPIILKDHLSRELYRHYLLLFCAVTLCSTDFYSKKLDLAEKLFKDYIEGFISIYGIDSVSSNIHNLNHVIDDVKRFGALPKISSYPFENMLGTIKNLLRSGHKPLAQIAKRFCEISKANSELNFNDKKKSYPILLDKEKDPCKIPLDYEHQAFKKVIFSEILTLSSNTRNKWFLTKDNKICQMLSAYRKNSQIYIYGLIFIGEYVDLFNYPFKSSHLHIFVIKDQIFSDAVSYLSDNVKCKLINLEYNEELVFFPLLHSLN